MKLLHYFPTTRLQEGGTVRAAIDLCTALARRGHDVTWLTTDDVDVPEAWKNSEFNCPTVTLLDPIQNARNRLSKEHIACATEAASTVDITHIHAMWLPSNPQMTKACSRAHTPWVLSTHGMLDDWCMRQRGLKKRFYLATVGRAMLQGATTFLTTAEEERRQAKRWLPHNNIEAIPLIVDLEPYKTLPTPDKAIEAFGNGDEPTVLFLSRIHEKKSIETLVDATAILKTRGVNIRVLIAGTGDDSYIERLKARTKTAGVSNSISFLGMVVGDLKLSLYAMADVFALPTQQENFGLVYPEAMLCGTPVITTKGTDIWRELEDGGGASIVQRTPQAFADSIELHVTDKDRTLAAGIAGRKHMLDWLDTESVVQRYERMYQEAINAQQS